MSLTSNSKWTLAKEETIRFKLTGLGLTGAQWIEKEESKNSNSCQEDVKEIFNSSIFRSCEKGKIYEIAILPGRLFRKRRVIKNILAEGREMGLLCGKDIPLEIVCLIRENYSGEQIKQMGIEWALLVNPIEGSGSGVVLLDIGNSASWVTVSCLHYNNLWPYDKHYIFLLE